MKQFLGRNEQPFFLVSQVVFNKVDKNKNGLLEPSEAVAGKWSLRGSTACKFAFLRKCDEDRSKNLSRQEWLKCFDIQGDLQIAP